MGSFSDTMTRSNERLVRSIELMDRSDALIERGKLLRIAACNQLARHSSSTSRPSFSVFRNKELTALVQFHGTPQRHFYTVKRFESGAWAEVKREFKTLDEAKAAV